MVAMATRPPGRRSRGASQTQITTVILERERIRLWLLKPLSCALGVKRCAQTSCREPTSGVFRSSQLLGSNPGFARQPNGARYKGAACSGDCGEGLSFRIPWDEWRRPGRCRWSPTNACRCRSCPRHSAIPSRACTPRHSGVGTAARRIASGCSDWRQALEGESAAGHLGKEVLHLFEPGYRRHPELH
jgi:hypothetical protein